MLSRELRTAILELADKGVGKRRIARSLGISRSSVRRVLASGEAKPPRFERAFRAEPYRDEILELWARCAGNLARVHEELEAGGAELSYSALTAFCRHAGIGQRPKQAAGRYHFEPGQEAQHDTSPHRAEIDSQVRKVQSVSSVLAYSGHVFFEAYPRFRRLECKTHLTHAFQYFGGVPRDLMIDNTSVIVLRGSGATMVPVPEMAAFAERLDFRIRAHEKGDANRSARVERHFHFIENNFLAGRRFSDYADLNAQAREWCDRVARRYVRTRQARPIELFTLERAGLRALPHWLPEPYELARRRVDVEGYVRFDNHHYSVPEDWIGESVEVRATLEVLTIDSRRRGSVEHARVLLPNPSRVTLPEHRRPRKKKPTTSEELRRIEQRAPEILDYVRDLLERTDRHPTMTLRHLLRMIREYPREPLVAAVAEAHHYGLFELDRLESMILRRIGTDFFRFEES